jgi:alpha-1,2-mannosyltransferase
MTSIWSQIRAGSWITLDRLRGYAIMLVAGYAIATVVWIALSHGLIDPNNKPLGTDFSNVYAAGTLAINGKAGTAYDWPSQYAAEKALFDGRDVPFYGWHYPPLFLMVAALLALFPYAWALALWMAATLPAYVAVIRSIVPGRETTLLALAYPAVFVNLGHGQNGFLSAALLGGALVLLEQRPVVAGVLIGLLAYKPQFGVLIPLVLLATGRWTVIAAACGTVVAACAATTMLFGMTVWEAFAGSTALTRRIVLEAGDTGWEKIQSAFSVVRMWGGSIELAYAVQAALAVGIAAGVVWLWRSSAAFELKASALVAGVLLATPYVLDYDLMILAVAIAFYARHGLRHGFRDFELSLLAFCWAAPLMTRPVAEATGVPLGFIAQFVILAMSMQRARREIAVPAAQPGLARA